MNRENIDLLLPSGGYHKLKSFQLARLIYDITVRFTELYIPQNSRTVDQMVQAARSGVQNIAEGSVDAATSIKMEINLYNVARASLIELQLDYQDYLRQHNAEIWTKESFLYKKFIKARVSNAGEFKAFINEAERSVKHSVPIRTYPYKSVLVANATILLIDTAAYFLKRQIRAKMEIYLAQGGFSEHLYNLRKSQKKF